MDQTALDRILNSKLPDTQDLDDFLSKIDLVSTKIDEVLKGKDVPVDEIVSQFQKTSTKNTDTPSVAVSKQKGINSKTGKEISSEQKETHISFHFVLSTGIY